MAVVVVVRMVVQVVAELESEGKHDARDGAEMAPNSEIWGSRL